MTIQQFKENCKDEKAFAFLSVDTEIWSNDACLGYVIKALQQLNYSDTDIEKIVNGIKDGFDWLSVDKAAEVYRKSQF